MENQHRQIKGYRELDEHEIRAMNNIKELAEDVGSLVKELEMVPGTDKRWVAIARTHLQEGFMALARSVAKPTSF
ncbi:hypothetical protein MQM1_043 [Aeromonas phage vB_AsaP_MQM1]|nr:hypothetical protein MQM1_043 [Aeromonas phage vB_AsaP_MQM1]